VPIYEYQCQSCGEITEKLQKFSDPPLKTCPRCGGDLEKVISNTTFILKGSGWYATDYGRKGNGSGDGKKVDVSGKGAEKKGGKKVTESPAPKGSAGKDTASASSEE
jgi:putative FmdB family regulatory protein